MTRRCHQDKQEVHATEIITEQEASSLSEAIPSGPKTLPCFNFAITSVNVHRC